MLSSDLRRLQKKSVCAKVAAWHGHESFLQGCLKSKRSGNCLSTFGGLLLAVVRPLMLVLLHRSFPEALKIRGPLEYERELSNDLVQGFPSQREFNRDSCVLKIGFESRECVGILKMEPLRTPHMITIFPIIFPEKRPST